jgi:serine phosphatase RsbU (regulator of sigma subunit)
VISNRRYTDLFETGQRTVPLSLAAEIQRRLLPAAFTCEADHFTLAGWLEPAGEVGGDTFDFSLDRDTLHISMTDAMGHSVASALLATLAVGALRNARRGGRSLPEQARAASDALLDYAGDGGFVTGQLVRVDLLDQTADVLNAGHPSPFRLRGGRAEEVEREAIQYLTHAVLDAVEGRLRDDATSLCFDWHGGAQGDRVTHAGAEHRPQHERQ